MKKKIKEGYTKSSDPESLIFLEMLLEKGHIPQAVVMGEIWSDERLDALHQVNMADTKKVKKSEEKT